MKVYVITSGSYSDYGIEAVALDKDEAERICATLNDGRKYSFDDICYIEEWDTGEIKIESACEIKTAFEMEVKYADGKITYFDKDGYLTFRDINKIEVIQYPKHNRIKITTTFPKGTDSEKAKKIMLDRIAEFKAKRTGIV